MRVSPALSVVLAIVPASSLAAQAAADPPYLRDFPTVDRVKQAMQVSDPKETALRQLGAFWQLQEILKQLSGRREFRGFTPGEGKLIGEYGVAEYYTAQAADSAFPGPHGRLRKLSDSTPYRYMRTDPRFGVVGIDVFKTLLTPAVQDQYYQITGIDRARVAARAKADSEARANGGRVVLGEAQQPAEAGSRKQMRLCMESGRSESDCLAEGLSSGFRELVGGFPELSPKAVGLRLVGTWPGPAKFALDFSPTTVSLNCADLVPLSAEYTLTQGTNGLRLTVGLSQAPLVFAVRGTAALMGPADATISGQIIVGYQEWIRTYQDGRREPYTTPVYGPATRRCAIGALTVSSPTTSIGATSGAGGGLLAALAGGLDRISQEIPTGLRMAGEYRGGAGLGINFLPEGAVVSCGDVGTLRPYTVQLRGPAVVIAVENGASPFTMTLGADGTLTGSGTVRVDGRKITGKDANGQIAYSPKAMSCPLSSLAPATGGPR